MANEKSTIQDLVESLATRNHCSRTKADTFLRKMLTLIKNGLNTDNFVKVKGLGTFKLVTVSSRESVDVNTGERIEIAEHQRVLFTPEATLKARVNKPFEKFETVIIDDVADLDKFEIDIENDKVEEPEEYQEPIEDETLPLIVPAEEVVLPEMDGMKEGELVEKVEKNCSEDDIRATSVYLGGEATESPDSCKKIQEREDAEVSDTQKSMPTTVALDNEGQTFKSCEVGKAGNETGKCKKIFFVVLFPVGVLILMTISYAAGYYHWFLAQNPVLAKQQPVVMLQAPVQKVHALAPVAKKLVPHSAKVVPVEPQKLQEPSARELSKKYEQLPGEKYLIIGTLEVHEMKATDTLLKLSKKIYGSKDYVKYIIFYNHLENPDLIQLGMKLKMPKLAHAE